MKTFFRTKLNKKNKTNKKMLKNEIDLDRGRLA